MKKFDLDAALNGEPVMLRNGYKAYIKYNLLDEIKSLNVKIGMYPLVGYRLECNYINNTSWDVLGISKYRATREYDIIGMWEEPKISIEDLPKPFKPQETESYYYINGGCIGYRNEYRYSNLFDRYAAENGNCFSTRECAEMWLKLMKGMLE
jgi:hypothetical protein|nr:MAG TPA: hypothetical protein [Caudoviricetes sp.]